MTKPINLPVYQRKEHLTNSTQTPNILVEIVYGLVNRDCKGMGICKINHTTKTDLSGLRNTICSSSFAYLQVEGSTTVQLRFLRNTISNSQYERRFQSGHFLLAEPFIFTQEWHAFLNAEEAQLEAGTYPVQVSEAYIQVDILLTKKPRSSSV